MVRSLYSGVAGMKVHQSRMDVVGNNIANVNTYGFKASRATFSDLYYQTLSGASGGSSNSGGTNPSQIGYGVQFSGVDLLIDRAAFTSTDRSLDVAIAGDGFFQVSNSEGNVFYTRSGVLQIDLEGNLVDGNGNFVLGISGDPLGKPAGNEKIQLQVPAITPAVSKATETFNNKVFNITTSNRTEDGNVTVHFSSDETLPGGQKVKATLTTTGVSIILNANEKFYTLTELNAEINKAITEANGGKQHPAGTFTITTEPTNVFPGASAIKGAISATVEKTKGLLEGVPVNVFGGMKYIKTSTNFSESGNTTLTATHLPAAGPDPERWEIKAVIGATTYTGYVATDNPQTVYLTSGTAPNQQYIQMTAPGVAAMNTAAAAQPGGVFAAINTGVTATASELFMGGLEYATVSQPFSASGAVTMDAVYVAANTTPTPPALPTPEGWKITATCGSLTYTGIVSAASTDAGTVRLYNSDRSEYIELRHDGVQSMNEAAGYPHTSSASPAVPVSTAMPAGAITGSTFTAIASSPFIGTGLTGADIISNDYTTKPGVMSGINPDGGVFGGLQFMTTSTGFSVPEEPSRVYFKATYVDANPATSTPRGWKIVATVGDAPNNVDYVGFVSTSMTSPNSLLLKSASGDYIQMSHPGITAMNDHFGGTPVYDPASEMTPPTETILITGAEPSKALGLSSKDMTLSGGTKGGNQTLADITNIAISQDGIIEATHSILGRIQLGRICLATFENPQGLEQSGNTYFISTANSGKAKIADPGASGTGTLVTSALEMSNVDLSKEFTEMITTQRGFQANSRVITVSDTLLEELINLKR